MADGGGTVDCGAHGTAPPAYVCRHLLASLKTGAACAITWCRDDDGHVNAWCGTCDANLARHGGNWNDETEAFAGIKLICEKCFDRLRDSNPSRRLA